MYTTIGIIATSTTPTTPTNPTTPTTPTTPIAKIQLNGKYSSIIVIHNIRRLVQNGSLYIASSYTYKLR